MTHVTDERKAQLDAAAEERAAYLEEVKHPVAGLHVQSLIDEQLIFWNSLFIIFPFDITQVI